MTFQKGKSGNPAGRKPGTPNRTTSAMREAILEAFERAGGADYLEGLAEDDPRTFVTLLAKLVPRELTAKLALEPVVVLRDYTGLKEDDDAQGKVHAAPGDRSSEGEAEVEAEG